MKFFLEVELGNDAMRTSRDVGHALNKVAHKLSTVTFAINRSDGGKIQDANGNTVGKWELTNEARIVIDNLPDSEENPCMKELDEAKVRRLFYDALGEFIDHRIPMRDYVSKRYDYMTPIQKETKLAEVARRIAWAALIKQGNVRLDKYNET